MAHNRTRHRVLYRGDSERMVEHRIHPIQFRAMLALLVGGPRGVRGRLGINPRGRPPREMILCQDYGFTI